MPDIVERVSPVDGTVITSRAQLAEHNRRNNVVDVGNDPAFAPGAKHEPIHMPAAGPDIKEAIQKLEGGYRPEPVERVQADATRFYGRNG